MLLVAGAVFSFWKYTQAEGDMITVCVKKDGIMHVIGGEFKRADCKQNESLLSWNIEGPQGPKGDKGDKGDEGKAGQGVTAEQLAAAVNAWLVEHKAQLIAEIVAAIPKPTPTSKESHVVIVADTKGDYWPRLSGDIERARGYYSAIQVAPPPSFSVPLPQFVLYQDGKPIKRIEGMREVENVLQRIVRGEFDPVAKAGS